MSSFPFGQTPAVISEDGGWCWFQSPRAILSRQQLFVGSVASGHALSDRRGDVDLISYDVNTGRTATSVLFHALELDDHDSPALLIRPDRRILAVFTRHGRDNRILYRISEPDDATRWSELKTFIPSASSKVTYSNLYLLPAERGRVYNFYRGLDDQYKPSYAYSDDNGDTWQSGAVYIRIRSKRSYRPYVRYASNGGDTIHMLYTHGHPRDVDNSLYHIYYRTGMLHRSDGTVIRQLKQGVDEPDEGTCIFRGDPDHVAWCSDVVLDASGRPCAVYSVQVGSAGLPPRQGGDDLRYRYARWDGLRWDDHALAYAGSRLYAGEDDYSGLAVIDPDDPFVVFVSTNADPDTGEPLISAADGKRHYELFRGVTRDGGATWGWSAITENSAADNLRPIRPPSDCTRRALIWLRGEYRSFTDYQQQIVGVFWEG